MILHVCALFTMYNSITIIYMPEDVHQYNTNTRHNFFSLANFVHCCGFGGALVTPEHRCSCYESVSLLVAANTTKHHQPPVSIFFLALNLRPPEFEMFMS